MKQINLTKGAVATVDDADFERLSKHRWCLSEGYAVRRGPTVNGKQSKIHMHREIITIQPGYECDHADVDPLNNQRANLRQATRSQNMANQSLRIGGQSLFKGVSRHQGKWQAQIKVNHKKLYLGIFDSELDAAMAYNRAAVSHFGEFARINKKARRLYDQGIRRGH